MTTTFGTTGTAGDTGADGSAVSPNGVNAGSGGTGGVNESLVVGSGDTSAVLSGDELVGGFGGGGGGGGGGFSVPPNIGSGGNGGNGGSGGDAVDLSGTGALTNGGIIFGGTGGGGGGGGAAGSGGGGSAGGSDGSGGSGGVNGTPGIGGAGGKGGIGIDVQTGGALTNTGAIVGGAGGVGGINGGSTAGEGNSGNGGAGVVLDTPSILTNAGIIVGGAGGSSQFGLGGTGGDGVDLAGGSVLLNIETITAGAGGVSTSGTSGAAGDAVHFGGTGGSDLIIGQSAVFNGNVVADGTNNLLELTATTGSPGVVGNIGTQFTGFDHLQVDGGATWEIGGTSTVGAVFNNGTITEGSSDNLTINGPVTGSGTIILDPTTVTLGGAVGPGQTVNLAGTGDTLILGDVPDFSGLISGFNTGDTIDLKGIGSASGADFNSSTDILTIHTSGGPVTLDFTSPASFTGEFFHVIGDGGTGIDLTVDSTPCYCPGTLIRTEQGEVPVETLAIGDRLVTISGALEPIRWIGRRSYAGRFIAGKPHILPIRIKAGALADHSPKRDLVISPLHAMYLDGVLIPAGELVNGTSIVQEQVEQVEYIHIELNHHDVIWAEGSASETFLDDDSRMMFHNAAEYAELYPDAELTAAQYCAPRVTEGYALEAIRQRLAERAGLAQASGAATELRGFLEYVGSGEVRGWAQDPAHPEVPVCLDVLADGKLVAQVLANQYRADLKQAGLGSGKHSFVLSLPQGLDGNIEVRRSSDRRTLASVRQRAAA